MKKRSREKTAEGGLAKGNIIFKYSKASLKVLKKLIPILKKPPSKLLSSSHSGKSNTCNNIETLKT